MKIRSKNEAIERINRLHESGSRFFFLIDFEGENCLVEPIENLDEAELKFQFDGLKNFRKTIRQPTEKLSLKFYPKTFADYQKRFDFVKENILFGNSFLANLTGQTPIEINWKLEEIFHQSEARFKLLLAEKFVCFSPEPFIKITPGGQISSFPMKGTIDASLPGAAARLLADEKEAAEHATIVDLIRNDLSQVARRVRVRRWRYLDLIQKNDGSQLFQVSSEVVGRLISQKKMGEMLFKLLPAGSISGAPKRKTVEIIRTAEGCERGFYTGIAGVFTGRGCEMRSCVLIRFIEKAADGQLVFRSGGGITHLSQARFEYDELIQKIYVPLAF